jgi:hypothetical protein
LVKLGFKAEMIILVVPQTPHPVPLIIHVKKDGLVVPESNFISGMKRLNEVSKSKCCICTAVLT